MNKKLINLSLLLASILSADTFINPLPNAVKATDNGGVKSAIDAYKDGIGAELMDKPGVATDNSAMNTLVFKYGEAAKANNVTVVDQIVYGTGTVADKVIAGGLTIDGASCNDNNTGTSGETWFNGVCQGGSISDGTSCNDGNTQTINDIYTNGVCSGLLINYFVSATGSNANNGSYNSPYLDFTNIPSNSVVGIKSGIYSGMVTIDSYHSANSVFKGISGKINISIYGESRDSVIIDISNTASRDENVIGTNTTTGITTSTINLTNVTVNHNLTSATNYNVSLSRFIYNAEYNNIKYNISGNYSLNYHNGGGNAYYNNCIFNGGNRLSNYSGTSTVSANINYPLF